MKDSLLQHLVCPACCGSLSVTAETTVEIAGEDRCWREIMSGWLQCSSCPQRYPIIKGVPRMLLGDLRAALKSDYPDASIQMPDRGPKQSPATADDVERTMRSFGFEWRHFSHMSNAGEVNFGLYFGGAEHALRGKTVLDVGCGKGRHLFYSSQLAATVIGIDLSCAVDAAFANNSERPNAHVVQADLFHLPFRPASFDLAYSLGVLHHLPDPEAGFRQVLRQVRPGGYVRIYVYWSMSGEPAWKRAMLSGVTLVRRLTTRMPFTLLRAFSLGVALAAEVALVTPYRILRRTRWRGFAETLPLKTYASYPFRDLYQDQFDRFSAPLEHRYDRTEIADWLCRAGLVEADVIPSAGWIGFGYLPGVYAPQQDAPRVDGSPRAEPLIQPN